MNRKNEVLPSQLLLTRKAFITVLSLIFMAIGSGCGTETDLSECPDTSFTQTNLDSLNANFIWRVCNASDTYVMAEVETFSKSTDFGMIESCAFSDYYSSDEALLGVDYKINNNRFFPSYLDHFKATKGLIDNTEIRNTPGKYSYFFYYDPDNTSTNENYEIEIEREAYHE